MVPDLQTWWREAVVYQIYPRSFADGDGDGIGDLAGILSRVDHLAELGVDVVWLSPVYPSPHDDNGYDISDYDDIDPTFGTLADFSELVDALHARGIRLVMDLVVNHTSDEHPWFVESRDPASPKRDWYWWRPARAVEEGGPEPTNWESFFYGPMWELDERSGEYYLHLFSRKQPDLNWENVEVRHEIYSMMRRWLDRGVDGFRMDVANLLSKRVGADGSLPDGEVPPGRVLGNGHPFFVNGPRIHEYLAEMNAAVFSGRGEHVITVGETPEVTVDDAILYTDPERHEVDMVFQFEHMEVDHAGSKWHPIPVPWVRLKEVLGRWQTGLADRGWNSLYWNNHDQPRVVSRFGDDSEAHRVRSAKALATVLHMQRGTPYIYQGEELAMTNVDYDDLDSFRDIETLNYVRLEAAAGRPVALDVVRARSRDNARSPMQWDGGPQAGFTTGEPWLAVNGNHTAINAEAARRDPDSVFHHYRQLIALRHAEPAVVYGDFTMLVPDADDVFAFVRRHDDTELLVIANVTSVPTTLHADVTRGWEGTEILSTNYGEPPDLPALRPWEALVLRRRAG